MKNECGKRVTKDNAYEVWQNDKPFQISGEVFDIGTWTYYVLKKYQSPDKEAQNEFARWHCLVVTPIVPEGEYGDCYIKDVTRFSKRIK